MGAFDPRTVPPEALLIALALFAFVALVQTARLAWRTWSVGWRLGRQRMHAEEGETRAARLVRSLGYTILGSQVVVTYPVWIDDVEIAVTLRADYLVSMGGRRFIAEVKTGKLAPRIETSATRRQLLEYRIAFQVDGVLLVDAEAERVHTVRFPIREI